MMNTENRLMLVDHLQEFKDALDLDSDAEFGPDRSEINEDIVDNEIRYAVDFNYMDIDSGASKIVVIDERSAFVVKIPFNGAFDTNDNYYELKMNAEMNNEYFHASDYEWDDIVSFFPFECADFTPKNEDELSDEDYNYRFNFCDNYCEVEVLEYELAKERGFGKYFADTRRFGTTKGGYPIYIQERCTFTSYDHKPSRKSMEIVDSKNKEGRDFLVFGSSSWCALFIDLYGVDELYRLTKYINKRANLHNDLHGGNLGYTLDGRPVITDFSGFFE